jgi:UDP-glucose 4-epimerase
VLPYLGRKALVTGGLGFIGSNLAIRLVQLGAEVTIIDGMAPNCGGNPFNVEPVLDRIRVIESDIGEPENFRMALARQDVVFNLAGEVSHPRSMSDPERDLRLNSLSQLRFLKACAEEAPGIRVVYAGTRQVYGAPMHLPVSEAHPTRPVDFNGVHKLAAEQYHAIFDKLGQLDCMVLRLTNVYGPRMAIGVSGQGFLVTYVNRLVRGLGLEVYGDGLQLRDPVYVDDVVDAFLAAGSVDPGRRKVFNIAGPRTVALREIAELAATVAGGVPLSFKPFPADQKQIDIGSFQADTRRARAGLDWEPSVQFREGIAQTLAYFTQTRDRYLDEHAPRFAGGKEQAPAAAALGVAKLA